MSMAQTITGWLNRGKSMRNTGMMETYATHTLAVLPDGQLMQVRKTSLAAAKDYLAAKNAIERQQRGGHGPAR